MNASTYGSTSATYGLSPELAHYARIEGLEPSALRPPRRPRRRSAAAVRDWVGGLRRPGRFVPAGQH